MSIILDVETNGLPRSQTNQNAYQGLHVIELAYLHMETKIEFSSLICHDDADMVDVSNTTRFHGITKDLIDTKGRHAMQVLNEFYDFLVTHDIHTIIGHNVEFDIHFLISESVFYNHENLTCRLQNMKSICTMKDSRVTKYMQSSKWPRLEEVYMKIFHVRPTKTHRALQDCYLVREVYTFLFT